LNQAGNSTELDRILWRTIEKMAADAVEVERVSASEFPANREINKEIFGIMAQTPQAFLQRPPICAKESPGQWEN
jgi:hypothetical protein